MRVALRKLVGGEQRMRLRQVTNTCTGEKEDCKCGRTVIRAKWEFNSRLILYHTCSFA